MNNLRKWMILATADEQIALAAGADTSRNYLYQLADSRRVASAEMGARIEAAAYDITKKSKGRLPKLTRMDVCAACRACPYASKCKA